MMDKSKTTEILTHMLDRLTDTEIATSDIKQMLITLNAAMQDIVSVVDLMVAEDAGMYEFKEIQDIKSGKNSVTKYIISEYFRENPKEAEELLRELTEQKVLFVNEIGES